MADKFCLKMPDFHVTFRDLLHAVNLRHGTGGFTSLPKEGVLRIFSPWKIRRLRPGLNPRTWVPKGSTLPLDHRSRTQTNIGYQSHLTTRLCLQTPSPLTVTAVLMSKHLYRRHRLTKLPATGVRWGTSVEKVVSSETLHAHFPFVQCQNVKLTYKLAEYSTVKQFSKTASWYNPNQSSLITWVQAVPA